MMTKHISPIAAARALTPHWMQNIDAFDALEIHPCAVIGHDSTGMEIVEPCSPENAQFWTVYGHFRTGGACDLEDFATEAEAHAFHDWIISVYPHLADVEG